VPEVRLDVTDAAELAEMLQFLTGWLARDLAALAHRWKNSSATPPTASSNCTTTWSGSFCCSAAATARIHKIPGRFGTR
jgi:hypothetical protein